MSYLLCINSSVTSASVAIAKDGVLLQVRVNENHREHAGFLQPAIKEMLHTSGIAMNELAAVCVTEGPGSYTGLRIGLATAKGICYALQIPLITMPSTLVMAAAALQQLKTAKEVADDLLLCPMIDARRMEVFTAVYNSRLACLKQPHPLILSETSFQDLPATNRIFFFGNGAVKWQKLCNLTGAFFVTVNWSASHMIELAASMYDAKAFASLTYAVPFYAKKFNEVAN
jgi:tRNA threonylcarbamoyladenosine biosynthesis protein TsaB